MWGQIRPGLRCSLQPVSNRHSHRGSLVIKSLAAIATCAVLLLCTAGAAEAAGPQSTIVSTPDVVRYYHGDVNVTGDEYITVRVSYRCTNTTRRTHYLVGAVTPIVDADTVAPLFVYGFRSDTGGTQKATCTGQRVRQTLKFAFSGNSAVAGADPDSAPGAADFFFSIERRGAQGVGAGWYDFYHYVAVGHGLTVIDSGS